MTALWWQVGVIYQIYPRSFRTPTTTASATSRGSGGGSNTSVSRSTRWISPIYRSPMVDFGYDVTDWPTSIRFGTLADFDDLLCASPSAGSKVCPTSCPTT